MSHILRLVLVVLIRSLRSRRDLLLENLALRQQLAVLARRHPQPRFSFPDPLLLDRSAAVVRGMAKRLDLDPARYDCALAPDRIQTVLELAPARARSSWKETHQSRIARTHLPYGL